MFIVQCPHCQESVQIEQTNCCIFRHAVMKSSGQQVPPHAPKVVCDALVERGEVYGCCKPFRLIRNEQGEYTPEVCDYI